jgi:hypothetical protein
MTFTKITTAGAGDQHSPRCFFLIHNGSPQLVRAPFSGVDFDVTTDFGLAGKDVTLSLVLFGKRILNGHLDVAR